VAQRTENSGPCGFLVSPRFHNCAQAVVAPFFFFSSKTPFFNNVPLPSVDLARWITSLPRHAAPSQKLLRPSPLTPLSFLTVPPLPATNHVFSDARVLNVTPVIINWSTSAGFRALSVLPHYTRPFKCLSFPSPLKSFP